MDERRDRIRNELIRAAKAGETRYYKCVGKMVSMGSRDPNLHRLLDSISKAENACGRPLLSALVIRVVELYPGQGFFTMAKELGKYQGGDDENFAKEERRRVHEYWTCR